MGIEYKIKHNIVIVSPAISLDIHGAPAVERELVLLIKDYPDHNFVLNLENVKLINSAGAGVFIVISSMLRKQGCLLKISNLNFIVRKVMDFLSMHDIIDICEDEEDAINSFSVSV